MNDMDAILNLPAHMSTLEQLQALADCDRISPIFRAGLKRTLRNTRRLREEWDAAEGVRWAGMQAPRPYPMPTAREVLDRSIAEERRRSAPRARFCAALVALSEVPGYPSSADSLRGLYERDFADERRPLNTKSIGACLAILAGMQGRPAQDALEALAELLMQEGSA